MTFGVAACAAAAVLVPVTAAPATAAEAPVQVSCSWTGAKGSAAWTWAGKSELRSITVRAKDTKADGMHPGIRVYWVDKKGKEARTPWLHARGGTNKWTTPAIRDRDGIKVAGIEIVLFRGNGRTPERDVCGAGKKNPRF
jgi:hypothetical protein